MIRLPFNLTGPETLYRTPGSDSYTVSSNGTVLGSAEAFDLPTGRDTLGNLLRITRVQNEDDASYLGRLQRLLIVSTFGLYSGSAKLITRQLSAYFGRVSITQPWDGITGSPLDKDTSFLDSLLIQEPIAVPDEEILLEGLNGSSAADLSGIHLIRSAAGLLLPGRDYLITGPGEFSLLQPPARPLTIYSTQQRAQVTLPQPESTNCIGLQSLPCTYKRFSYALPGYTPLAKDVTLSVDSLFVQTIRTASRTPIHTALYSPQDPGGAFGDNPNALPSISVVNPVQITARISDPGGAFGDNPESLPSLAVSTPIQSNPSLNPIDPGSAFGDNPDDLPGIALPITSTPRTRTNEVLNLIPGDYGPFLRGKGLVVSGLDRVALRLLFTPGGNTPTPLGLSTFSEPPMSWANAMTLGNGFQVGLDL